MEHGSVRTIVIMILAYPPPSITGSMQACTSLYKVRAYYISYFKGVWSMSTFMKLREMLVESVLLYGAEVWGCGGQLRPVENVQMRAARIFLGVGRLHPLVSLQFEMNMLPVKWEAMKRSMEFWVQVMRMADGKLLKTVMIEALELGSKVKWVKD